MKTMKKIVAILAVALMLCSILPLSVFAADDVTINTYAKTGTLSGTTSISWASGDYQVVSYKNTSSTAIRTSDADHFRYYVGNKLVISGKDGALMSKVVITCTGSSYMLNNASNTLGAGWTVSASGTTLTYTPDGGSASELTITIGKQSRSSKIVITPAATEPEVPSTCEHVWVDANCTTAKTCSKCGITEGEALGHDWEIISQEEATCTAEGSTTYECAACGADKAETIPALPHNYVDGFCSACGEAEPLEATITFDNTSKRTTSTTSQQVWEENGIVVTYDKNTYTNNLADYSNPIRFYAGTKVTISYPSITKVEIVANTAAYATTLSSSIAGSTAAGKVVTYVLDKATDSVSFVPSAQVRVDSITVYFEAPAASDCEHDYVGVETQAPTCSAEGVMTYTCSKCQESYTEAIAVIPHSYVEDIIDATCTTTGTKTYECSVCFDSYDEVIPVKPHNYVDDVCADCGHVKAYKGTITFDNTDKRTELTDDIQVWKENGITVINNKDKSTTNVANYSNPARFYKNSELIVEFPDMISLVFNTKEGASDLASAIGANAKANGNTVTVTFDEPQNSLSVNLTAGKVFVYSITAVVAHECVWADATCTAPKTCSKCGATEGEALGHTYFDDCSAICEVCGYEREVSHNVIHVEAAAPTCTAMGNIEFWYCADCGMAWLDEAQTLNTNMMAVKLPMSDHSYDNEFDAICNDCDATREVAKFPISEIGQSISEDVSGYAVLFEADVDNLVLAADGSADYTNAEYKGYKLIEMGVTASNNKQSIQIKGDRVYGYNDETGDLWFAFRIINIPESGYDTDITMVPYYTVLIDGVETTIEGDAVVGTYNTVPVN